MNLTPTLKEFPLGAIHNPFMEMTIPAHALEELRVKAQTLGNLMICFDATHEARVIAAGEPHLLPQRVERVENVLVMESPNLNTTIQRGQHRKTFMEVHVPMTTCVNIDMTAGVVMLRGGTGDVEIKGKAGEITGITFARRVDVHLHAGDVSFNDLQGTANIHVSAGNITLGWEKLSGAERIDVSCKVGAIDLQLPQGAAAVRDFGGMRIDKKLNLPNGSQIHAKVNLGGLDILHWQQKRTLKYGLTV